MLSKKKFAMRIGLVISVGWSLLCIVAGALILRSAWGIYPKIVELLIPVFIALWIILLIFGQLALAKTIYAVWRLFSKSDHALVYWKTPYPAKRRSFPASRYASVRLESGVVTVKILPSKEPEDPLNILTLSSKKDKAEMVHKPHDYLTLFKSDLSATSLRKKGWDEVIKSEQDIFSEEIFSIIYRTGKWRTSLDPSSFYTNERLPSNGNTHAARRIVEEKARYLAGFFNLNTPFLWLSQQQPSPY